jgi:hypothetical protein
MSQTTAEKIMSEPQLTKVHQALLAEMVTPLKAGALRWRFILFACLIPTLKATKCQRQTGWRRFCAVLRSWQIRHALGSFYVTTYQQRNRC